MPYQSVVTVQSPLRPGMHDDAVRALLAVQAAVADGSSPLFQMAEVHYLRLTLLPATVLSDGAEVAESLLYMADVDGPARAHLRRLAHMPAELLDAAFGSCTDYPVSSPAGQRLHWLKQRRIPCAAAYVNTVGRGARQIVEESRLRGEIEDYLEQNSRQLRTRSMPEVESAVRAFVAGQPQLAFARKPPAGPPLSWRLRSALSLAGAVLPVLALSPLLVLLAPLFAIALRRHERTETPSNTRPEPVVVEALRAEEDRFAYNPFSAVGEVKPTRFRRFTLAVVLIGIRYATRWIFNHGSLGGVTTIHFARWVYLDDRRRVMFASYYDGSLESYMDDFIDEVAWGLNAVFSNGIGYPRTRWLFLEGARREQDFKNFLRTHQLPTQVSYSAYPTLSAANINNNAQIRSGLVAPPREGVARWLTRL